MTDVNLTERAERMGRKRTRVLPMIAAIFLVQQVAFFSQGAAERAVDHVRIGAWAVLSVVILAVLTTGGHWFHKRELRALLDDELTRANRSLALATGFVCAMLTAIILFVMRGALEFTAGEVIHLIVSAGIVSALLRFAMLERRAYG